MPQQIAASLQERLIETGKAETRRTELENQNTSDEANVASCRAKGTDDDCNSPKADGTREVRG